MPTGRCRKGSLPPRKRKGCEQVESRVPLTTESSNSSVDNIQKSSQCAGASSVFSNITMGPLSSPHLSYNSFIPPNSPVPLSQGLTQNYDGYMSTIPTSSSVAPYPFQLCFLSVMAA